MPPSDPPSTAPHVWAGGRDDAPAGTPSDAPAGPPPREPSAAAPHRRILALDGLRGLAVLAVVAFHAWPGIFPGGFVGVDLFFVLSGYLITAGLVRRLDAGKGPGLRSFWVKRARRLWPALAVLLVIATALSWLAFPDASAGLRRQWLGALTYTGNWLQIAAGQSYFEQSAPPLFEHLWSLAVEEQFYLLWPLLLWGLCWLIRPGRWGLTRPSVILWRTRAALALAAASALGMALGFRDGEDPSRLYFGTDTHSFGLLLGAAVALLLAGRAAASPAHSAHPGYSANPAHQANPAHPTTASLSSPAGRWAMAAWAGLAMLAAALFWLPADSALTYRGGLVGLCVVLAGLVLHLVTRHNALSSALSARWLRWCGRRSYAAYLWHWPLLVIGRRVSPDALDPLVIVLAVALTFVLAELSGRWVEDPIMRHGFKATTRAWARGVRGALSAGGARRNVAVAWLAAATVVVLAAAVAIVAAPSVSALQTQLDQARSALQAQEQEQAKQGAAKPGSKAKIGTRIDVIGDSVTLAAAPSLLKSMPGINVKADVGRQAKDAPELLGTLHKSGNLRPIVVVSLGTNGKPRQEVWDEVLRAVGPQRTLVLVTPSGDRDWIPEVTESMRRLARDNPDRVKLADWNAARDQVTDFASDGIHPGPQGAALYSSLIKRAAKDADAG